MRRRGKALVAVLAALALIGAACGDDDDSADNTGRTTTTTERKAAPTFASGTTMARLQSAGKMKVGVKFDQNLFGVKNPTTNEIEGFDAEVAKIIARGIYGDTGDIDDKIEFVEAVSRVREEVISNGTVDLVIATYTINDARKQQVDFAGPYYLAHQDVLVKKDDNTIKKVEDLNGKKVCTATGSTSLKNLQAKAPQADVSILFDRYSLCVEALEDGRVQAVTTDDAILHGFVEAIPGKYKVIGSPFSDEPYGIGLKRCDVQFLEFVNDTLEESFRDGSWKKAFDTTVGKSGAKAPKPPTLDRYTPANCPTASATTGAGGGTVTTRGGTGATTTSSTTTTTARGVTTTTTLRGVTTTSTTAP